MFQRNEIEGRPIREIVAFVHAHLASRDARDRFEAARFGLSQRELLDLAERMIRAAVEHRWS